MTVGGIGQQTETFEVVWKALFDQTVQAGAVIGGAVKVGSVPVAYNATVTSVNPLRIRLDGQTNAETVTPIVIRYEA